MPKKVGKKAVKKVVKKVVRKKPSDNLSRVLIGIPNYDSMVRGGYKKNSTNLLVGGGGGGKSIFSTQFLITGMKRGEKCLYVTFEERKQEFYQYMKDFGWDLEEYEKKGLFTFLQYTPVKVRTMLEEGGGEIERTIVNKGVKRIVIDSITSFALLFEDELAKRQAALSLFGMIRDWDCTSLLTLEEEPILGAARNSPKTLEFEVDSLTFIYFIRRKGKRERFIEVMKMRGTDHSKSIYSYGISSKGISIGKSQVSDLPE
jgi:KaiC/GvpD/RAD55 family RecA-like ATPase